MTMNAHGWRRCERCGFSTGLMSPEEFADHDCIPRLAAPIAPTLQPLFHSVCGAVALYSTVPVRGDQRVPSVDKLLLHDGQTPMWTPTRAMLLNRTKPKAPACPKCGGSINRRLRTAPIQN